MIAPQIRISRWLILSCVTMWAMHCGICDVSHVRPCLCGQHARPRLVRDGAHCNILQHTATRCNTLRYAATYCNILLHSATCCNVNTTLRLWPTFAAATCAAKLATVVHAHTRTHTHTHTYTRTRTHTHTHAHTYTYKHIHTHTHTHAHTHKRTHTDTKVEQTKHEKTKHKLHIYKGCVTYEWYMMWHMNVVTYEWVVSYMHASCLIRMSSVTSKRVMSRIN